MRYVVKHLGILSAALLFNAAPLEAEPILVLESVFGGASNIADRFFPEKHWSSPDSYANVGIAAFLGNFTDTPLPMRFFVTTSIGPGTTDANEVVSGDFVLDVGFLSFITLTSGLTLGPGT
jgi:hypothetical protein